VRPLLEIKVGARGSPLSRKQVEEVYKELKALHPHVLFHPSFVETVGDRDKKTSLRLLDKTDFFTREIDHLLLKGECRIAIHSAKDLPHPLPPGLALAALTKGVDPSDSLVLRHQETLPQDGIVATSSERREASVKCLFPHARFVDIRGTIEERLARLDQKVIDGVVIAEAALIRLGLTTLNRLPLPGENAPLQGRLAVIVRQEDHEMLALFKELNG
jgi:hydroxymethylbilane synthase